MTSYPDLTKDLNHLTDLYEKIQNTLDHISIDILELDQKQQKLIEEVTYLHKQINNHTKATDTTCP